MQKNKFQSIKITEAFITAVVVAVSVTLVASGIAISKINTEYMTSGIRAAKIVAERDNQEIFISMNDKKFSADGNDLSKKIEFALSVMPAPVNTGYFIYNEINSLINNT